MFIKVETRELFEYNKLLAQSDTRDILDRILKDIPGKRKRRQS